MGERIPRGAALGGERWRALLTPSDFAHSRTDSEMLPRFAGVIV